MVGKRPLLKEISLQVRKGEFVALHGANGVGKSTLLRLLAGVVPLRSGQIEFCGKSIGRMRWPGIRGGVGYLPQEPELAGPYAIRNATFERQKKGNLAQWNEWARQFGLNWNGSWSDYWVMSAGQRAQAALMVQLVGQPRLWMFDEPTTRLDANDVQELFARLRTAHTSLAAIVVSHDDALLNATCDRHVELTSTGMVQL
jgi:ABC-type multidrug transport system ATPase subunit